MTQEEARFRTAIDCIPGLVWSSTPAGEIDFLNKRWLEYTGLSFEKARGWGWQVAVFEGDLPRLLDVWKSVLQSGEAGEVEARLRRFDGAFRWFLFRAVPLRDDAGNVVKWYGQTTDIEDFKRAERLLAGEKRLLEMIAQGSSLAQTLDALCRVVEEHSPDCLVSILLSDARGERLWHGAGPSLPPSYTEVVNGRLVNPPYGPCGAVVVHRVEVISPDIASDTRWSDEYRAVATAHGLRACWSSAIASSENRVLGTFAINFREPGTPPPSVRSLIERFTHLAGIAIERAQDIDALRRSEERYALAVNAAGDGHTDWIVATDEFYASPRVLEMCGLPPATTFRGRADFVARFPYHPEDRDRVVAEVEAHFAASTARLELDMRILRAGETRWLHLTGLCSRDASGRLVRWNAALTDVTERKRAEVALSLSEERYARAMEAAEEGHWEWEIPSDAMFLSARGKEMLGFGADTEFASRDELFARQPVHPEDRDRLFEVRRQSVSGGLRDYEIEYRVVPRPGEIRWLRSRGKVFRDARNVPVRITGSLTDITRRKLADEALSLSEQRYALAMEATGDGHWDWNIETGQFYASPLLLEMYDLPADAKFSERSAFTPRVPFHPDDRPRWESAMHAHFAGRGARLEMDLRIVVRSETRWIHLTGLCLRDAHGKPVRWTGSVTDITERKRVTDELGARQEMLDLAQKAARAVAFEWHLGAGDGENRWSPDLESMVGLAAGTYDGTYATWKKLVHAEDWPAVRAAIESAQETGDVSAEYRVVHRDGGVRWLQAKGRLFLDRSGNPARIVGFMIDVTERRLAQEELARMERQLRQAQRLEAMGTLAGGIAHDFNNLLGAILGYGEMALRDTAPGSRLHRDVESILVAGERARSLVDRILAFSRSGVGERVAVRVQDVAREAIGLLQASLPPTVVVEQNLDAGDAAVLGDATQFHQVVMNLATNAVHAMPSGGVLRVSLAAVSLDGPRTVTTGKVPSGRYLTLEVADTGIGIRPDLLERIFDPFFTTRDVGVGTGLGLSLVHGIVTGLGGAIDVTSRPGDGSVFTVLLPRVDDVAALPPKERMPGDVPRGREQSILVVDDEEALVRLSEQTLVELGYTVASFTSSAAALEAFAAAPGRFDAMITDESMPGLSGSELIRKMRMLRPALPVVLVSGYVSSVVARRARDAGADEVLKKPFGARDLAASLARVLQRREQSSGLAPATPALARPREPRVAASREAGAGLPGAAEGLRGPANLHTVPRHGESDA